MGVSTQMFCKKSIIDYYNLLQRQEVFKYLGYYLYLLIEKYHSIAFHNFPTDIDKIGVLEYTLCIRTDQKVKPNDSSQVIVRKPTLDWPNPCDHCRREARVPSECESTVV